VLCVWNLLGVQAEAAELARHASRAHNDNTIILAVALTVFLFSFFIWAYVVVIQVTHPDWVYGPFSHIRYPPFSWRLDEVGMLAFGVSAVSFLIYQIERMVKVP
jgi:uncharacterized RDD family membrane protein YckC